jgi:regulator of protease activity HflC (stomatin/prohibitin superfamily)
MRTNDGGRCGAGEVYRGKGAQMVTKLVSADGTEYFCQAEQERQAAVIRAEGEAEAAATISRALEKAGEAFVALRKIEASKAIVQSLSRNGHVAYIPSSGGNVLLNVPSSNRK